MRRTHLKRAVDYRGLTMSINTHLRARPLLIAAFVIALGAAGCAGNGGSAQPAPPIATATPAPPSTQSQPQSLALVASSPLPLPTFSGFSGTITYGGSIPSGTTVTMQSFLNAPSNAPAPQAERRSAQSSGSTSAAPTAVVSFTETFSSAITFPAFPIIHLQIPSTQVGEYTAEVFDTTNPLPTPYYEIGTGSSNSSGGVTVVFSGGGSPFTVNRGDTYVVEVVFGSALGLPPPTPTEKSSVTEISGAAQAITIPAVGGFSGQIQIPANSPTGEQSVLLNSWNGTPTSQVPLDNTGTAGSNDFSIEATLATTETFPAGLFAFSLTFPSSLQLSSSSVVTIFLCTEGTNCTAGNAIALSPSTYPSLFTVSGQTITFSGIPIGLTMTMGEAELAEVYIHY
jgi:hypothetical protein